MPPSPDPTSPALRVGLVGYGSAGRGIHAPLIVRAGLTVAAVSTSNATRADEVRADHPGAEVVPDLEALLGVEGLDLVVLASPSGVHATQAEQVIAAGVPLVVDKPLAVDSGLALGVVDLAAHHGVPLTVFNNRRFDPEQRALTTVRDEGLIGDIWRAEYRWDRWRPVPKERWREQVGPEEGGGLLLDLHSHLIDQAVLLHGEVESVYAELDARTTVGEDDTFVACRHVSGIVSHVMASSVNGAPGPRARLNGSAGAYVIGKQVDDVSAFTEFANDGDAIGWIVRGDEREHGPVVTGADQADFYRAVAGAIVSDDPQVRMPVDPRDAVHVLAVIDAARVSSRDGRVVPVLTPGQAD
ncbi:oxidoreductase [Intrasporangium oryzae NRRL B-24470]|uniref:Oxidoreductase n=1 Tax=Intrasporangium oryzae NRRL B-24470 TaxID=1386089 RepID=W9G6P6_9MICO|nr:Gfo/Idh/MocA family oxidoreductase [Intrasporangium oryzae]EWT01685.1 oxidoreductase [Intrasporangium oryzae NRRL B-24470]